MKKRIALAAAAALAGGLLVAAPASAAASVLPADRSVIAGASNFTVVAVNLDEATTENVLVTVSGSTLYGTASTSTVLGADGTVSVATPAVGTITVNVYDDTIANAGQFSATASDSMVITVTAAPVVVAEAYNHTTIALDDWDGYVAGGAVYSYKGSSTVAPANWAATYLVNQYSSAGDDTLSTTAVTKAFTVSLSGVGVLNCASCTGYATYLAFPAGAATGQWVDVLGDGRSGVATITFAVNGVAVATKTVTFYGDPAKYTAAVNHAQTQVGDTMILTVKSFDAAGIAVPVGGYTITDNESTTVAALVGNADDVVGVETYTVSASAKSAGVITVGNGAAETATVVANFVTAGVASIVVTADKASYAPGEKATFSIVAKNADGVAVGDSSAYTFSVTGSTAFYGAPTSVTVTNGAASFSSYMPVAQGPVIAVVTLGGASATLNLSVVDPAAAAQAAAITALQTSVATLTTTVASLVASMTAQIKVINATMLKIQKQLAALRAQVNKL